ncbi:MAG: ATP-dependent protease ATPase subunit HslU [Candidatus Krumholzibacteriota bacterium]|nr:ATP-dependent protease ATPase subunit HslU [Candidatus Krumholzibacteriota bacterium]
MDKLIPKKIVEELDKYIIGQNEAKKSVAIALRNRWRRRNVEGDIKDEIMPNNIIMIGPTGVGKTEVARRLANLAGSPFVKVEATKFTEIGYVGRDVELMIRDLVSIAISTEKEKMFEEIEEIAHQNMINRILDLLLPASDKAPESSDAEMEERRERTKEKLRKKLINGDLDERQITVKAVDKATPMIEVFSGSGIEEMGFNIPEGLKKMFPDKKKNKAVSVGEAKEILLSEEKEKLLDMEKVVSLAIKAVEETGIVFIDEIDKIAKSGGGSGPDVSREGVQRDILPIVEGSSINTKYGTVKTDHILFMAAGAFHMSKPSDLIPELQGRFPIRVELDSLTAEDFEKILTEPKNALIKQYSAMIATEECKINFTGKAIKEIANMAFKANQKMENIGARRLHTVLTTLLEDILFELPSKEMNEITITAEEVREKLEKIVKDDDMARYVL